MEFKELVKKRRSCRAFSADEVPKEKLDAVIEAACWAPSPLNLQPWEFVVITQPKVKTRIREIAEEARRTVVDQSGPAWTAKYDMRFLEDAPVLIAVTCDPSRGGLGDFFGQRHGSLQAASAAVQNLLLAAADEGLGGLWFTFFAPEKMKSILDVPENMEIAAIVPLGYPAGTAQDVPRKSARVYHQKYGRTQ
jgi:nitroreductase